jgi:hypothetical protein
VSDNVTLTFVAAIAVRARAALHLCRIALIMTVAAAASTPVVAQDIEWVRQFGSAGSDGSTAVATDPVGNVYVGGTTGFTSSTPTDAFLALYDSMGRQVWLRQFGTSGFDGVGGVAIDKSGNVYVAGGTSGTFAGQIARGANDAFVAKYNTAGEQLWVRQFGTVDFDAASSVATDPFGNVFVGGMTSAASEDADSFVAKYDAAGNQLWMRQFAVVGLDEVRGVATDSSGFVYFCGIVQGTFPGQISSGNEDAFLAKYDTAGNQVWLRQFGTTGFDSANAVATDNGGNVYVAGESDSSDGVGVFLAKYDTAGNQLWIRQFESGGGDVAQAVATAATGQVYVAGRTFGTFAGQMSPGLPDVFVARYDLEGNQISIRQFGTDAFDAGWGVATDHLGDVYVGGQTNGTFSGETSAGDNDAFLAKLTAPPVTVAELIANLRTVIENMAIDHGTKRGLDAKLASALRSIGAGDREAACGSLRAFVYFVTAQTGKKLSQDQVDRVIPLVNAIRVDVGCR